MSDFTKQQAQIIEHALASEQMVAMIQGQRDRSAEIQEVRMILSAVYDLGTDFGDRH